MPDQQSKVGAFTIFTIPAKLPKSKTKHASNDNLTFKPDAANLAAYLRRIYTDYPDEYNGL